MSAKISVQITPEPDELRRVVGLVEELGEQEQWSPKLAFQIQLVLDEIGDNFLEHGSNSNIHAIEVILISHPDTVTLEIVDDGLPFDPLKEAPPPDLDSDLEDRPVGGLGLHLVRTFMDDIHYRRDKGKNHLIMTKRRDV